MQEHYTAVPKYHRFRGGPFSTRPLIEGAADLFKLAPELSLCLHLKEKDPLDQENQVVSSRALSVVTLELPPLRTRPAVVLKLLDQMARDIAVQQRRAPLCFSADARSQLQDYAWPGNLREMNHMVRGLSASFDPNVKIGARDLGLRSVRVGASASAPATKPERMPKPVKGPDLAELFAEEPDLPNWVDYWPADMTRFLEVLEYRKILQALRRLDGNVAAVARDLGYRRPTLIYRITALSKQYGGFAHRS